MSAVRTVLMVRPLRRIVTWLETAITSGSLWEMKMIVPPAAAISRTLENSWSLSCGVRTVVGSSRIRMRAPRYRAFRISTRWRSPSESCQILARGSIGMWNCSATSSHLRLHLAG